jgi:hypothetical protein
MRFHNTTYSDGDEHQQDQPTAQNLKSLDKYICR